MADMIERLRAERDDLLKANALLHAFLSNREAEIERLWAGKGANDMTADHQKRGTEKLRERLMGGRKTAFIKWWDSLPREKIVSAGEGFDAGYAAAIAAVEIERLRSVAPTEAEVEALLIEATKITPEQTEYLARADDGKELMAVFKPSVVFDAGLKTAIGNIERLRKRCGL